MSTLFFAGCASFHSASVGDLEKKNLVGYWVGGNSAKYYLEIHCSAAMSKLTPAKIIFIDDTETTGMIVNEVTDTEIKTGPFFRATYPVQNWPHEENGRTAITFDGYIYYKSKTYDCSSYNK